VLGLLENVIDIPYDMISSIRIDKGVFSSPNDTKIMTEKAGSLIVLGRYIEAIGWLDKALSINPTLRCKP
jgi:hypothetical protein